MRTLTTITPATTALPPDLALLLAPVRIAEPSAPDEFVGRAEGVLLDERGRILAFVLRLAPWLVPSSPRTLVSAASLRVTDDGVLHLDWTRDQLLAEPRLDAAMDPHPAIDGGSDPHVIPPSQGVNGKEAFKEGLEGGAAGAALGALAGLVLGGPIAAIAMAGFFATGGALGGVISGATLEPAVEAGELKFDNLASTTPAQAHVQHSDATVFRLLEEKLRDPALTTNGLVHATRFAPEVVTEEAA